MGPVPCERCSSWRSIYNIVRGCDAAVSYKYQPLSESLQCQRTGRTLVICDACTSQQRLECSSHSKGGQTPQGWGCSSSTALQPPRPAGSHPHPTALGLPHPELTSTHRCGGLFLRNIGRVRLECLEPLGVSRRKCTATAPIPKIWASLPNIPQLLSPTKHLYILLVFTHIVLLMTTRLCELNI